MTQSPSELPQSVALPYTGGHTVTDEKGYVHELCPDHPSANRWGFVPQHRLVVERAQGQFLPRHMHVHHKDEAKSNNDPDNLQVLSRRDHMALHRSLERERRYGPLERGAVARELQKGGLKAAAKALGVHSETIRNNFPDLVEPYKRRSPARIDDPAVIAKVIAVASNDKAGYREVARQTGISFRTCQRICERNGIPWTRKSRKGETHRTYRRKTTSPAA